MPRTDDMAVPSVDDFDFIQLVIHDVHGLPRGRMMAKRRMASIIKDGLGIYAGERMFVFCTVYNNTSIDHEQY